ncbi:MAG: 2-octaprenyl-6-methoxyphenyl hydroxylase [Rhodanobacteraceae bacterium]|nr:2-octaprenyl-6-methoxyphenyl hydroxylase [Rhodanobacteraceae bacterium]MBP9155224.1 2-octaprenyl-6-methoxyphenyl hydroxylase [Xanthomonadales bacterium]HQW80886.1 2-octaprenyl-6-methoxyphenyl hydroxylase [Pseudomonadota bacterium]
MNDRTEQDVDVVIVGGGLVGMSLALALERVDGLRVLAIEAQPPPTPHAPRWDERHFALGRASTMALDALGVAHGAAGQYPIRRIHVSRRGAFGRTLLDAAAQGLPAFGQIVPARQLAQALESAMAGCTRMQRRRPARLQRFVAHHDHIDLNVAGDAGTQQIRARLLVAADGTDSAIRTTLGIPLQQHDYGQTAIVTAVEVERDLDGCAYERFTDSGPMALLPLDRRRAGLVMALTTEQAASVLTMADEEFLAFAEQRFGTRLGRWRKVGQRQLWPLHLKFAERVTDARIVVIGNAAQTIHPIGAQGFNLGLRDALALADVVAAHRADAGSVAALAEYAERRREDRERTTRFSDALVRFMASDLPIGPLRSLALLSAEHVPLLRHALVHASMGFR